MLSMSQMTGFNSGDSSEAPIPGTLYAIALEQYSGNLLLPNTYDGISYFDNPQKILIDTDVIDITAPADQGGVLVIKTDGKIWGGGVYSSCNWSDPLYNYTFACDSRYYSEIPELGSGWTAFGKVTTNSYSYQPVFAVKNNQLYYWGTADSTWHYENGERVALFSSATPTLTSYSKDAEIWLSTYNWVLIRDQGNLYFWASSGGDSALGFDLFPASEMSGFQQYNPSYLLGMQQVVSLMYGYAAYLLNTGDVFISSNYAPDPQSVLIAEDVYHLANGNDNSDTMAVVKNDKSLWACRRPDTTMYEPDPTTASRSGIGWRRLGNSNYSYTSAFCHNASGIILAVTDAYDVHIYTYPQIYSDSTGYSAPASIFNFNGPIRRLIAQQYGFLVLSQSTVV